MAFEKTSTSWSQRTMWLAALLAPYAALALAPSSRPTAVRRLPTRLNALAPPPERTATAAKEIVLISGFETFNLALYRQCASAVSQSRDVRVTVFSDQDLATESLRAEVERSLLTADAFVGSLLFDYDACEWLAPRVEKVSGPRLIFECATELMALNCVGDFEMGGGSPSGPPPPVKAVLGLFGSSKEEDKMQGYLNLLKVGPELLRFIPGNKAVGLRMWLTLYRYWNEGGSKNVESMLATLDEFLQGNAPTKTPSLVKFPQVGLVHPAAGENRVFQTPSEYLAWRSDVMRDGGVELAAADAPRVAVLLYRKHVVTKQPYIPQLIEQMEQQGLCPVPIFITGVEAHTIVRDLLTSSNEQDLTRYGITYRPATYQRKGAARVDAIVNTIGFALVGGPAGSMAAGRNVALAESLLNSMDIPYFIATPLLLQDIESWQRSGITGLQSVVSYALPELDGATDTVIIGGLAGETVELVPERVTKMCHRLEKRIALTRQPLSARRISVVLYGYPPNIGAVGTAALLNVPKSLDALLGALDADVVEGEAIVAALALLGTPPLINNYRAAEQELVNAGKRARAGDKRVAAALGSLYDENTDGLVASLEVVSEGIGRDDLELGVDMRHRLDICWPENREAPGIAADGSLVISGLLIDKRIFIATQPLLGYEGDPTRLLFQPKQTENRLTPHPQYVAFYDRLKRDYDAVVHFGTHGTVEWLPGQALGNDAESWSDELLGRHTSVENEESR